MSFVTSFCRDEVEQEYQEKIVLQLAEQEEEEIDRIKEESRKLKQAILEKFKAQKSQQKHELNLEEAGEYFLDRLHFTFYSLLDDLKSLAC